jgi:hypothetical protein
VALPAYCRVDGVLDRRTGGDGKPYGIGFAIALPDDWNGRFLQQGGGGLNGSVGFPIGAAAAGTTPALVRGFAVVSTDTGHTGANGFDANFMREQQAALDFAYQAVGRVASLAKQIVASYYSRPADHSYCRAQSDRAERRERQAECPAGVVGQRQEDGHRRHHQSVRRVGWPEGRLGLRHEMPLRSEAARL